MTKNRLFKNIAFTSIPTSIVIFAILYFITKNINLSVIVPVLFLGASGYSNFAKFKQDIRRQATGISKQQFKSEKVYDLITTGDLGPALCFELGNEKYLIVNGQWIFDPDIYGEEAQKYHEEDSTFFNGYKRPFSFPAKEFEIWTSDLDGNPIRLNIIGEYLEPEEIQCELPPKFADLRFAVVSAKELNIKTRQQQNRGDGE